MMEQEIFVSYHIPKDKKALQNRAFATFRRYRAIEILTYSQYAPVPMSLWP